MRRRRFFHPGNLLLMAVAVFLLFKLPDSEHIRLEAALLAGVTAAAFLLRQWTIWTHRPPAFFAPLRRLSRIGWAACAMAGLLSIALRLALLPWVPVPDPVVPDEYSHLFLAKTFLAGRLANPPHPLWQHFETLHVISQPTFSSMYVAGQACFLALGKVLTGSEFGGILLSTALMCSAIVWFLRVYVPPGWALFGGVFAAVRFGAESYWNNSYWGGSVAALGGALMLGAYPRLTASWAKWPAAAFAAGALLVLNTRPWEGLALGAVLAVAILYRALRRPGVHLIAPATVMVAILAVGGVGMALHFKAVTGNAFTVPYQVNQRIYGWPMSLPWFPVRAVEYRHAEFEQYRQWEIDQHRMVTQLERIPGGLLVKFNFLWRFFLGIAGLPAFLFADRIWRNPRQRAVWAAAGAVLLAVAVEQTGYPHYAAPVAPAFVLFFVSGARRLMHCGIGRYAVGPPVLYSVFPIMLVTLVVQALQWAPAAPPGTGIFVSWCCVEDKEYSRAPLERRLLAEPGEHLVFVRYEQRIYDTLEWVYNDPDIDRARIVFARDMGVAKNEELLRYYPARRAWSVVVKDRRATLTELPRR